jgi:pimeloyl-ACP methyl ester carboxylesterase
VRGLGQGIGAALRLGRIHPSPDVAVLASGFASLDTAGSRSAFLHTVRSVIDTQGQRVSAVNRLHLAAVLPTLIVWGEQDSIIPPAHGYAAHEAMPDSRLELFPDAGHMPHHQDPARFAAVLSEFCSTTESATLTADHWRP